MVRVFARPRRPGFRLGGRNDESGCVKCARSGAMHAGTAKHRLRFLGFARNDRGRYRGTTGGEGGWLPDRVWLGACACSSSTAARASGSALAGFAVEGVGPRGENVGVGVPALWRRGTGAGIDRTRGVGVRGDAGHVQQITPGVRLGHGRHVLRRPFGDQFAAAVSRQRPEVDQPIGVLDQIEVVLDQYDGIAGVHKPMQHVH